MKYSDIGGMDSQKQEIREAVELAITEVSLSSISLRRLDLGFSSTLLPSELTRVSSSSFPVRPVQEDWYRSSTRCAALRSSRFVLNPLLLPFASRRTKLTISLIVLS